MDFSPQPKKFRYTLNIRGVDTEVLENAPDGWLDTAIKYTRSQVYNGLLRSFTLPLKFTFKGATLLRNEFYKYGFMSLVKILIEKLMPSISGMIWGYGTLYDGKIDFSGSETVDSLGNFAVNAINNDFSTNVDAYDGVQYAIPLQGAETINIQLTALTLKETATFLPGQPPDNHIHADYFPPMQLVNNTQNSVSYSSQQVVYSQLRTPDFSTDGSNFFYSRVSGKLLLTGSIQAVSINQGLDGDKTLQLLIINQTGTTRYTIISETLAEDTIKNYNINLNLTLNVAQNERLFLFQRVVEAEAENVGMTIIGGQLNLSYNTISPPTMCQAVPANYLYKQLLQAMNVNTDSGPNLPVPSQSYLLDPALNGLLKNLYITCSDSIRSGIGSMYTSADNIFEGIYLVLSGTATYNGNNYNAGQSFAFVQGILQFTGDGIVQKTQSFVIGIVFNTGDTLQAGGTYLVGGVAGSFITYNSIDYPVGRFFTYVFGQDTFTGSDDSSYVLETSEAPQMIISFSDFFKSIKSVMGGQAAFGVENGICFLEDLGYVYRAGLAKTDLGNVTNFKYSPATDMMCNSIQIGYKDQQYDQINGFQEVNSTDVFTGPNQTPATQLDLVSIIRADPYGIETLRISEANTSASRSDNDLFFIWKKDDPEAIIPLTGGGNFTYYNPLRTEGLMFVDGVPQITGVDPSYYNWKITPKQNLLRGSNYLASIFYNFEGYQLTLSSALKNSGLVTIDNTGRRVAESDPVLFSSLPAPYFIPIYCSFNPGLTQDALQLIDSAPYSDMNANVNGVAMKVFINEISVDEGQNSQQDFKTLLTPANDLTKLIV